MELTTPIKKHKKFKETEFYKFNKKHKKAVISITVVVVLLLAIILPFIDYGTSPRGNYEYAFNAYKEEVNHNDNSERIDIPLTNSDASIIEEVNRVSSSILSNGDSITYTFNVTNPGDYEIYVNYYVLHNGFQDSEFSVYINNELKLERSKLRANWQNETNEFELDSYNNQLVPSQTLVNTWQTSGLYDYDYKTALPVSFGFKEGVNTIKLTCTNSGQIALSDIYLKSKSYVPSYEAYSANHDSYENGVRIEDLEGEKFTSKNDTSPIPSTSTDINAYPYDTVKRMLNSVSNFNTANQIVNYEFEVSKSGLYIININGNVNNSNHTTFASIFIDGEIPFGELMHYPFENRDDMYEYVLSDNNGEPFKFYLEAGKHTLSIKIDKTLFNDVCSLLETATTTLNRIYLDLKKIAGTVTDNNKEWDPENDFPGVIEELEQIVESLNTIIPYLYMVNGSDANFQATIYLRSAISGIEGVLKEPKLIPNNYAKFGEGTGSIIENIANAKADLETTPLEIDRIIIGSEGDYHLKVKHNKFDFLWENVKKFFLSFTTDYSGQSDNSDKTLDVWVARSRQYVDLMQQMIDQSDFKEKTGYDVKFTLLADESKLILSNAAGISPDAVMGISNWLPYEMGIRGLTVDLTTFEDYGEVIDRFSEGALISLIADGIGLGLPETQDFYVMYYRDDIVSQYGFDLPDTWQDVIEILPELQRNGFNYYIPLSTSTASKSIMTTAPFIYQYGGNLFSDDGTHTTIDEENSLDAIKLMTELYTLYGLEDQVSNFFNSFRNGSLPIGVSTFDTYVRLTIAAPEISGKWKIALPPGVKNSDGVVERWQTGSAQSMCLIDQNEEVNNAGWELLKWWTSADVQTEFSNRLTLLYGKGYIWNSANLEAFNNSMVFTAEEKNVILGEWEWMREIPRVPGWYMLERELSNAWNDIVLNGQNTRAVIEDAVTVVNNELERKLIEFGYLDDEGNIITPYKVTTLESIEALKEGK